MIPPKQKAPEGALANPLSGASLPRAQNIVTPRQRSEEGRHFYSAWLAASSRSAATRYAVNAGQESPAIYSRDFPHLPFTPASVNLRPPGRSQRRLAHELEILRQGGGGAVSGSIGEIQKHLEAVKDLIVEGRK